MPCFHLTPAELADLLAQGYEMCEDDCEPTGPQGPPGPPGPQGPCCGAEDVEFGVEEGEP